MVLGLTADFESENQAVFYHTAGAWPTTTSIGSQKDVFLAETLDLLAAIREDGPTAVPMEERVRSLRFVWAAAESADGDMPVEIGQVRD